MTKQEEIRDKIIDFVLFSERQGVGTIERTKSLAVQADEILSYLHYQGVVIKVERELPELPMSSRDYDGYERCREDMADHVAVESLIKE